MAAKNTDDTLSGKLVRERCDQAFADTTYERRQYWLTQSFLDGEQWVNYEAKGDRLFHTSLGILETGQPYPMVTQNVMGPAKRRLAARVLTPIPWEVPVLNADSASQMGARVGEAILSEVSERQVWADPDADAFDELVAGGTAAILVSWDRNAQVPLAFDSRTNQHWGAAGDVVLTALGVDDFAVEPGAHTARTARWMVVRRALPPGEVKDMFGLDAEPGADASAAGMIHTPGRTRTNNLTSVYWYYERPHGDSPGREAVVVGEKVVQESEWSYPFADHLPIGVWEETPVRRRAYARSWMWGARSLQLELNLSRSHVLANMTRFGSLQLIVDESFSEDWSDMPGVRRIARDPMNPRDPSFLVPPPLPGYVAGHGEQVREQINDMLGANEIMVGNAPDGISAASALSVLIEQNDTTLQNMARGRARLWGQVGTMVLELYQAYVKEPRKLDRGKAPAMERWTGKDLLGHTRVRIPTDRLLPKNKAANRAHAELLVQMGLVKDVSQYAAVMGIGPDDEWVSRINPDRARAERENHEIAAGRAAVVEAWDDDRGHIECHTEFAKSAMWDVLSDESQRLLREHLAGHEAAAAEKAGKMVTERRLGPELAVAPEVMKHDSAVEQQSAEQMMAERSAAAGSPPAPVGMPGGMDQAALPAEQAPPPEQPPLPPMA